MEHQQPSESDIASSQLSTSGRLLLERLFEWSPSTYAVTSLSALAHLTDETDLYHYTTLDGLKGITESHSIWATAINYLNDASEINYGCAVLNEVLAEWKTANEGKESWATAVLHLLVRTFNDKDENLRRETAFYVACFCEEGNLLSQWRTYGQAGGYSIGFTLRGAGLARIGKPRLFGLKPEKNGYEARLVPVIYDPTKQRERLHELLKFVLPIMDDADVLQTIPATDMDAKKQHVWLATLAIENFLLEEIVGFKNPAFAEEHEWRVVVRSQDVLASAPPSDGSIGLRPSRGLMVPYVRLVPTNSAQLPITSIRFGPSLQKSRAENSLKMLCALNGYKDTRIEGSNIPVVL